MAQSLIKFTLEDLNKFAPAAIVFETRPHKLFNGKIKHFIYAVPVEYIKKYPDIEITTQFTRTPYSLDDLTVAVDFADIANAQSPQELSTIARTGKAGNFGMGDWPYHHNDDLFRTLGANPNLALLNEYGKIMTEYAAGYAALRRADDALGAHNNTAVPKKSIFNNQYRNHIKKTDELTTIRANANEAFNNIHKKATQLAEQLLKDYNPNSILSGAYNAAFRTKINQKFQSRAKYAASEKRTKQLGVRPGKESGVVHNERLANLKQAIFKSPYKPIHIDQTAATRLDSIIEKAKTQKTLTPAENKVLIKMFFDKDYE